MKKRYEVILTTTERGQLPELLAAGTAPARLLAHARILLKADQGPEGPAWVDERIAEAVETSQPTVSRVRKQCVEEGLEAALHRRAPTRVYRRKRDGAQEARLVALACSAPPRGQARWTLRLLAGRLVELEIAEAISYQTVRRVLKKPRAANLTGGAESPVWPDRQRDHGGSDVALGGSLRGNPTLGGAPAKPPDQSASGSPLPELGTARRRSPASGPGRAGPSWDRPFCVPWLSVRDALPSRRCAPSRCWSAAVREHRSNGRDRTHSWRSLSGSAALLA